MRQILIILLLLISLTSSGTNYYVSTSGNDANDGLSTGAPFKTLVKGRTMAVNPGDTLFLKRGDVWKSEVITIQASGTHDAPIVVTAYGTGAKPIITCRDTIVGWSKDSNWTPMGSNIWRFQGDYFVRTLWIDGVEQMIAPTSTVNETSTYFWEVGTNYLYVYSVGNPGTLAKPLEMPFTNSLSLYYPIRGINKDYIHLINLDIRAGSTSVKLEDCDNWLIDSCNIGFDCAYFGIAAGVSSSSATADSVIIRNCVIDTRQTIKVDFWDEDNETGEGIALGKGCDEWQIYNNVIANWKHACIMLDSFTDGYENNNIKIHHNYFTTVNVVSGRSIGINGLNGTTDGLEFYKNISVDIHEPDQLNGSNIKYYNNIINRCLGNAGRPTTYWGAIGLACYGSDPPSNEVQNNEIYNNIFANSYSYGISIQQYVTRPIQGNKFYNNIFYNNDTINGVQIYIEDDAYILDNEFKNNLLFKEFHTDSLVFFGKDEANDYYKTVAEFNAKTGTASFVIADNIGGDPLFVDATNDTLIIGAGSPAINAGIDVGLTTDFLGNMISSPPDIGAIEYNAPVPPSTGTVFMKYNGKLVKYKGKFMKY